jgi:SPP1 gp7 family putative phage head morphogenesis protein
MELTRIYAGKIRAELKAAVDTRKLAEAWAALYPQGFAAKGLDPVLAQFLARAGQAIMAALRRVLPAAWTEGWALGQQSAIASARSVASAGLPEVNWGDWEPGDVEAAYQVAGSGLRDLLASQEVNIKSIAVTELEKLGDLLAGHLSSPETVRPYLPEPVPPMYSVGSLADALEEVLDNPERAELVAHTEIARAQSQAAQWVFRQMGVSEVRVSTAGDRRVCQVCTAAEADGAEPIGTYTVPLHPRCRCATVAVSPPLSDSLPGVAAALAGAS